MKNPRKKRKRVDTANAARVSREGYSDVLSTIQKEGLCPFCEKDLLKFHTQPILIKGKHWLVTTNAWPYQGTRRHFLLITRKHVESAEKLQPEAWLELQKHFKNLCKTYSMPGATLLLRSGETKLTGASVHHLHAQIIFGKVRKKHSNPITAVVGFQ